MEMWKDKAPCWHQRFNRNWYQLQKGTTEKTLSQGAKQALQFQIYIHWVSVTYQDPQDTTKDT